jgi:hypothetical protein
LTVLDLHHKLAMQANANRQLAFAYAMQNKLVMTEEEKEKEKEKEKCNAIEAERIAASKRINEEKCEMRLIALNEQHNAWIQEQKEKDQEEKKAKEMAAEKEMDEQFAQAYCNIQDMVADLADSEITWEALFGTD